jgi:DNA helicase-2/ATP-dependent DNA helicase PcrA
MLDEFEQQYFVYKKINKYLKIPGVIELIDSDRISRWNMSEVIIKWVNKVKEEMLSPELLMKDKDVRISAIGNCCKFYNELLTEENAIDFASIQTETYQLLRDNAKVLKKIQSEIKYIMVDEYQDTNTVQELILLKMASANNNICVVGDDDQGLYRFRGATIRNILEFRDNFKKDICAQINLVTNYRSHPQIIKFYSEWMKLQPKGWGEGNVKFRFDKEITAPKNERFLSYESVIKVSGKIDENNWSDEVINFIKKVQKNNSFTDLNQMAFFVRSQHIIEF